MLLQEADIFFNTIMLLISKVCKYLDYALSASKVFFTSGIKDGKSKCHILKLNKMSKIKF